MRTIEGYGDKYKLTKDGRLFRRVKALDYDWKRVAESQGRVRLYRKGKEWRPLVSTLMDKVYGEGNHDYEA